MIISILFYLLAVIVTFIVCVVVIGYFLSGPKYTGPVSDHFNGKKFFNPHQRAPHKASQVIKWMFNRKKGAWKKIDSAEPGAVPPALVNTGIRITFVNHSTFLIQADGLNILTDPIWSKRTGPVEWAGPMRMRPPGLDLESIPKIDLILISHNHWDHLDIKTLKKLENRDHPAIITSLGVSKFLQREGLTKTTDLDWWDETLVRDGISVQAVPAQHFSGRGIFDRDATLWSGLVLKRPAGNIYFAGDTGYNVSTFKEIGARCSPIAVALIPIGAYKPEWFMSPIHCSPHEAVKIHQECRASVSIASHFGTFGLADDGEFDPPNALRDAISQSGIDSKAFLIPEEGEALVF